MNADGSGLELYASGVRNTVGFDWHPSTGELWFTDNGRDNIGGADRAVTDNSPPCELNRATSKDQHFGYPYCHSGNILDPGTQDNGNPLSGSITCEGYISPAQPLGPHVAPLGMKFGTSDNFPEEYKNVIFIAEHGSWNRTRSAGHTGHKVTMVMEDNGQGTSYTDFISGFLGADNKAWGRPVDLLFAQDGSMLLSDDHSGTIYRIWYENED